MPDELTRIENESIRKFVQQAADDGYLSGRVLDYGCGRQPYRDIVEAAGGDHFPFDRADFPANVGGVNFANLASPIRYDTILCTQVIQYVPDPGDFLSGLSMLTAITPFIDRGGHLVLTYPTNWPEVQDVDLHRFTKVGMERLLTEAGFEIVRHEMRESIHEFGYDWALGYGVIARA